MWMNSPQDPGKEMARYRRELSRQQKNTTPSQPYAWRWFSGAPLDGVPRTDATWFLPATQSLDPTYRGRFHTRPRIARAGIRTATSAVPPAVAVGWWVDQQLTFTLVLLVCFLFSVHAGWKVTTAILESRHQRRLVRPLAKVLAPVLETNPGTILRGLDVPRDYLEDDDTVITVPLMDTWRPDQVSQAVKLIQVRLGGEWNHRHTKEAPYFLHLTHKPAPPTFVSYKEVAHLLRQGHDGTPLMGIGTEETQIRLDFDQESPHVGMSVGTGGGKSSFLRLTIGQMAYHGVKHFTVIDPKMVSLQGMEEIIPGLKIYSQIAEEWAAIARFRQEMDRRYQILLEDRNAQFDRWVLVLEEQNSFALESDLFWKDIKEKSDPARPHVWTDIAFILLKARQVKMNVIAAYQRMDDRSTGGMGLRDQFGMKLLSRFSPSQWDMLVGTRPRAVGSNVNGRWTTVLGGLHRQVQVPFMTIEDVADLMEYRPAPAVSPGPVPSGVTGPPPEVKALSGDTGDRGHRPPRERLRLLPPPPENLGDALPTAEEEKLFTLKEACEEGILPFKYDTAKRRRTRAGEAFPAGTPGEGGTRYTKTELCEFFGISEEAAKDAVNR